MKGKEYKVTVTLHVPDDLPSIDPWSPGECLWNYVSHWLEEGYFVYDHLVELPDGIQYRGFEIDESRPIEMEVDEDEVS